MIKTTTQPGWAPVLRAERHVPQRFEPLRMTVESRYDPAALLETLTVCCVETDGVAKREISFAPEAFTAEERVSLVITLGRFVAEARGGKLA